MKVLGWVGMMLLVFVALLVGCKSKEAVKPPEMALKPADEMREGQEKIVWQRPEMIPGWVDTPGSWTDKKLEALYFLGVGLPNEYEQKADASAAEQAGVEASRYLFNMVDEKTFISDKLRNSQGYVPVQSLARDLVGKNMTAAIVRGNYGVSRFTQYCCKKEYGAHVYFYKVYRLFEMPKRSIGDALKESQDRIQEEYQREKDELKKEMLKGSEEMLRAMQEQVMGSETVPTGAGS